MICFVKICQTFLLTLFIAVLPSIAFAADDTVDKTICKLAVGYQDVDEIKADLLVAAKREVINELFGEMIVASTAVENFVVTSDQIRTSSIGFVRVDGNADFFNGKGFAEVCVTLHAYVTDEDRAKFNPEKIGSKFCDSDDDLTTAQLIAYVKDEAVIQKLIEYEPKLKGVDRERLLQLVQKVTYRGAGFITDTQTYCATFEGYVVPVEVTAFLETGSATKEGIAANPYNDEFNRPSLNPNWYWLKEDPSRWSLETVPGKLQIIATGGDFASACNNYQNILLQPAPSGDFEIETRVIIRPTQNYQLGGLIVFDDLDNWVKLNVLWSDGIAGLGNPTGEGIELLSEQNSKFTPDWPNWPISHLKLSKDGIFLKLSKIGNLYESSYSSDGKAWVRLGSLPVPTITKPQIGIIAIGGATSKDNPPNCTHSAPDIPVNFDFFHVTYAGEDVASSVAEFKSGTYRVQTKYAQENPRTSTWVLEISGNQIIGLSEWDCCPGPRTDSVSGTILSNKVVIQRDCSGQGGGACSQTFIGTLTGDVITGYFTGNTISGKGSWTLYLQE